MIRTSGAMNGCSAIPSKRVVCLLFLFLLFPAAMASAQDCDFFVNATDGDDGNPGTLTQPIRSFETAYQGFPSSALVCLAAGEYFLGPDGDGIELSASDKSMTFRLESFGGSDEVRFSEGMWILDAGSGQITFESGTASRLAFGVGIENTDAVSPSNLNFLHTLELRSGTLDVTGVTVQIGPSVGSPSFSNPDNSAKKAPSSAAFGYGNGRIVGSVSYLTADRVFTFASSSPTTETYVLPADLGTGRLVFSNTGPVAFDSELSFSGSTAPVRLLAGESGHVSFSGGLRFKGLPRADTLIAHNGSGAVSLASLASESSILSDTPSVVSLSAGGSLSISGARYQTAPAASDWIWRPVVGAGTLTMGAPGTVMTIKSGLDNTAAVLLAGDLVIEGSTSNGISNGGMIDLGTSSLTFSGDNVTVSNAGSIVGGGGGLTLAGSSTWNGTGPLPGITAATGVHNLSTSSVAGSVSIGNSASVTFGGSLNVTVGGSLSLGTSSSLSIGGTMNRFVIAADLSASASGSATGSATIAMGTADFIIGRDVRAPGLSVATATRRFLFENGGDHVIDAAGATLPGILLSGGTLSVRSPLSANGAVNITGGIVDVSTGLVVSSTNLALSTGSMTLGDSASWTMSGSSTLDGTVSMGTNAVMTAEGNLTFSGSGNHLTLGSGAHLDGRADLTLNFVSVSGGPGSEIRVGADLTVTGPSLVLPASSIIFNGNKTQSALFTLPTRFDRFRIDGPQTHLSLAGTLQVAQDLDLAEGSLSLLTGASLLLGGSLTRTAGLFSAAPGTTIRFTGTGNRSIVGFDSISLPGISVVGPSLSIDAPITVVEDLIIGPGAVRLGQNTQVTITDSLTVSAGALTTGDGSTVVVNGRAFFDNSAVAFASGATLRASNDVAVRSGTLLATEATFRFQGGQPIGLDFDHALEVGALAVEDSGTVLSLIGGHKLKVRGSLRVGSGTRLSPGSSVIDLTAASGSGSFICDGVVTSDSPGSVLFSGGGSSSAALQLSGSGTLGNTTLALPSSDAVILTAAGSSLALGGSLVIVKGRINLQGTPLDFAPTSGAPSLAIDLSDGFASPRLFDSAGGSVINASQTPYDLSYTGSLLNIYTIADEISYGPIRNLSMGAVDALNTPAVFGVVLPNSLSVTGSLSIVENALFRLDGVDLTILGTGSANIINGRLNGSGALIIKDSGAFFSNTASTGGSLMTRVSIDTPSSATVHLTNLSEIATLDIVDGTVVVEGGVAQSPMLIQAGITHTSGTLDIRRSLDLGTTGTAATWSSSGGSTLINGTVRLVLSQGSRLDIEAESMWSISPATDSNDITDGGFVVFRGGGFLKALSSIPRLKLTADENGTDDLFFTGNVTISDRLVIEDGDLFIGNATLTHLGSVWQQDLNGAPGDGSGDDILGDFSGTGGTVRLLGSVRLELGGDLTIQSPTFEVASVTGDTVTVRTLNQPHTIVVANNSFSLSSGTLDLGRNDLVLQGNSDPLATLDGGAITGTVSDRSITIQGLGLPVGTRFPYVDDDFGELVLRSPTAASVVVRTPTDISNLRVDRSISLPEGNAPLIVGRRLVFGEQGAGVIMSGSLPLTIGSGASIVRRGGGILSAAPVFTDTLSVFYDIDDGDISGHDSKFTSGTLFSGVELPGSATNAAIRVVGVLSGGAGSTPHSVRLANGIVVGEALIVFGGTFDKSNAPLHFGPGASLLLAGADPAHGPVFSSSSPYTTDVPFGLTLGSAISSITINDGLLPPSVTVADLTLRMGAASSMAPENVLLTANRTVASLLIDNLNTSSSLNTDGSALNVTGAATIVSGSITSGPATLLNIASDLRIEQQGAVSGSVVADVAGNIDMRGTFSGLTLQAEGNVRISGSLSIATSLLFAGRKQVLTVPSGGLSVSSLTLSSLSGADSPGLTVGSSDGTAVDLRVTSSLLLRNGILRTGSNTVILEGAGSGFDRQVASGDRSHILGRVRRSVPNGFSGDIIWPVGDSLRYRPLTVTFDSPVITQTDMTVRYSDVAPFGETGFPISTSGSPIVDTLPYTWTVQSSVNFARSLPWSFTMAGVDDSTIPPNALQPVLRSPVNVAEPWRVPSTALEYGTSQEGLPFIRTGAFTGGLDPIGTLLSVGTPARQGSRIGYQVASFLPLDATPGGIDVYVDGALLGTGLVDGQGTSRVSDGLSGSEPESRTAVLVSGGDDPDTAALDTATFLLAPGNRGTIVAALDASGVPVLLVHSGSPDAPADPTRTGISILNLSSDRGAIDAVVPWPTHVDLATVLSFGSFSPSAFFDPALTVVGLRQSSTDELLDHFSFDLSDAAGEVVTMISTGMGGTADSNSGGSTDPLVVRVLREDGTIQSGAVVTGVDGSGDLPQSFQIRGNYPNPFNSVTNVSFDLAEAARVRVEVFDLLGRRVLVTPAASFPPGPESILKLDASRLASGVYIYRVLAQTRNDLLSKTSRMIVLK